MRMQDMIYCLLVMRCVTQVRS